MRKMNFEITELPVDGLVPVEQLQAWKDYNLTEIKLFSELIFPLFNRFVITGKIDTDQINDELLKFFSQIPEEAQWRIQLIRELKEWIDLSRIESPGAEVIYQCLERIIVEGRLQIPIKFVKVDESDPGNTSPSTCPRTDL